MIRELLESDIDEFNKLYKFFNNELVDYCALKYDNFKRYYVYIIKKKIVGFLVASIIYERSELEYIYVVPNYRSMGIATNLMKYYFNLCVDSGCINITLEVNENNIKAINLYKKFGFEIAARRCNYYGNEDALLMIKRMGSI